MMLTPFLTRLDTRAAIKGSRDPLAVQPIWSRLGRHVVGNLTTVSNSVADFSVLLLGYHFAQCLADQGGGEGDVATFLKWEQLCGYARHSRNRERGFRGTERVSQRLAASNRVELGTHVDGQILSNQKTYGLWGLYTVAAKASGLLEGDPTRLTAAGRTLVDKSLLPTLGASGQRAQQDIIERLRKPTCTIDVGERGKDAALLDNIATVIREIRPTERRVYRDHLLHGGPGDADLVRGTRGRQRIFAELLAKTVDDDEWRLTPKTLQAVIREAQKHTAGQELAERLTRIRATESVLAPAVAFFEHLLGCDGQSPTHVADKVRTQWGKGLSRTIDVAAVESLETELHQNDADSGRRWVQLAHALHDADYEMAIRLTLEQNAAVMKARGASAPWADISDHKVHVRYRDEQVDRLPEAEQLPSYWRHAYFVDSLRSVTRSLQ